MPHAPLDAGLLMEQSAGDDDDDLPPLVGGHEEGGGEGAASAGASGTAAASVDPDKFIQVPSRRRAKRKAAAGDDDGMMDTAAVAASSVGQPPQTTDASAGDGRRAKQHRAEIRTIAVPSHRLSPLRHNWVQLVKPIVEHMKLQVRYNKKMRRIELRNSPETGDVSSLQKADDFCRAFVLGFDVNDALALLRLDDIFVESFEIDDVKPLKGEHLSRAIGRLAGKDGRTKFTIENATKTRIVLADAKIHVLGSYANCRAARHAICSLIMGAQPSKVYGNLRNLASRAAERF